MNPKQKQRMVFALILFFGTGIALSLILYALTQNVNLFFTPSEVKEGKAPSKRVRIKVGGMVEKNSLERSQEPKKELSLKFKITDFKESLVIYYNGILPDLFREGQGVVATGYLEGDIADSQLIFKAEEILAKHDENYMPPELKDLKAHKGLKP